MAKTIYKTLFEVKFLHEFYLTDSKGESVFNFDHQEDRITFLIKRFEKGLASINDDLEFVLPDILQVPFKNYHLHLLKTYSGFQIATEVAEKYLGDGSILYAPKVKLPDDFNLFVIGIRRNHSVDVVSNNPLKKSIPSIYYFTNQDLLTERTFPSLSESVPPFDLTTIYEQGELASFGPNDVRQFYRKNENDIWDAIVGSGFVNKRDQLVVPRRFVYQFDVVDNVTSAVFELRDQDGGVARSFNFNSTDTLQKVTLNFKNDPADQSSLANISSGNLYSLSVTINNTKTLLKKIIFMEGYDVANDYWAVLNIKPKVTNADFNLYTVDGFLQCRKLTNGNITPAPVFEVRMKSRFTYWKYSNDEKGKLVTSSETENFLESAGRNLITKKPRGSTYLPTLFENTADNTFHHLPNPSSYEALASEDRKVFTHVLVPKCKLFPVET